MKAKSTGYLRPLPGLRVSVCVVNVPMALRRHYFMRYNVTPPEVIIRWRCR
ncbi:hypothetical protein KCP76_02545 [Salmonella enterica subsp. enterica serovar Weltevreden]|nr:hypothetical protein KCP76_02545 [Salmonella enterica subsp. enterica serovar Weltevreden]